MNRWAEFKAGTLTPPAVVQKDTAPDGTSMIWVWDGTSIIGPVSRKASARDSDVAVEVRDAVKNLPVLRDRIDELRDTVDEKNARIDTLQATIGEKNARIDALQVTIDQKNARIDTLQAKIAQLEKP